MLGSNVKAILLSVAKMDYGLVKLKILNSLPLISFYFKVLHKGVFQQNVVYSLSQSSCAPKRIKLVLNVTKSVQINLFLRRKRHSNAKGLYQTSHA